MSAALLTPHDADRDAWLAARRKGIGASEIAAVMGISPWESPFSLYWRKVNGWDVEETEQMRTGTLLEPAIADWAAEEIDPLGNLMFVAAGLYASTERPWQLATPDRLVYVACTDCDGPGWACGVCDGSGVKGAPGAVLECKWTGSWDGWGEQETDDIPVHYRAQVQQQCDVMDVADWFLAVLGPSGFRLYRGRRDERDLTTMRERGRRFMANLDAGVAPPLDEHHATLTTVKRLHPDLDDTTAEISDLLAAGYRRACDMHRTAKGLKARYEIALRAEMGASRTAVTPDGEFVASRSIYDVAEHTVQAHRVDRLNPPRTKKEAATP